ncbi:hypothetical protein RYA05_00430 [Pseudomonas syringae pv. actinidiae]|nr:hypothetical protein [Pseudomonas syringae pv. actinidiae]
MPKSLVTLTIASILSLGASVACAQEDECPSCATEMKYIQEDLDSDAITKYRSNILVSRYSFRLVVTQNGEEISNQVVRPRLSEQVKTSSIHDFVYVSKSTYNSITHRSYLERAKVKQGVSFDAQPLISVGGKSLPAGQVGEITLVANLEHYSVGVLQITSDGEEGDEAKPDVGHVVQAITAQVDLSKAIQQEIPVWSSNLGSANTRYTIFARAF